MVEAAMSSNDVLAVLRKRRLRISLKIACALVMLAINAWYLWQPSTTTVWLNFAAIMAALLLIAREGGEYQVVSKLWRAKLAGEQS